jgi:hypothetical protein
MVVLYMAVIDMNKCEESCNRVLVHAKIQITYLLCLTVKLLFLQVIDKAGLKTKSKHKSKQKGKK